MNFELPLQCQYIEKKANNFMLITMKSYETNVKAAVNESSILKYLSKNALNIQILGYKSVKKRMQIKAELKITKTS